MLARLARYLHRRRTCPHQIAHRLMRGIRHPDRRQLIGGGAWPASRHRGDRSSPVHPPSSRSGTAPPRCNRAPARRADDRGHSRRTRLIAEMQPLPAGRQLLSQFADLISTMQHRPPVAEPLKNALRPCSVMGSLSAQPLCSWCCGYLHPLSQPSPDRPDPQCREIRYRESRDSVSAPRIGLTPSVAVVAGSIPPLSRR